MNKYFIIQLIFKDHEEKKQLKTYINQNYIRFRFREHFNKKRRLNRNLFIWTSIKNEILLFKALQ